MRVKFQAKADAERICMTLLKSILDFDSQKMEEEESMSSKPHTTS